MRASLRLIVVLFCVGLSTPASAAEVGPPPSWTDLRLLGHTANGQLVVLRNGGEVLVGGVSHGVSVDQPAPYSHRVYDLTGNTLRWAEPRATGPAWRIPGST